MWNTSPRRAEATDALFAFCADVFDEGMSDGETLTTSARASIRFGMLDGCRDYRRHIVEGMLCEWARPVQSNLRVVDLAVVACSHVQV